MKAAAMLAGYEEANKLFEDSHHAPTLAKYREPLKVWDHPAIRYNAAVALINLDLLGQGVDLLQLERQGVTCVGPDLPALSARRAQRPRLAVASMAAAAYPRLSAPAAKGPSCPGRSGV